MLGMRNYTPEYIDQCHPNVDSDLSAYRRLAAAACTRAESASDALDFAAVAFRSTFFNKMVLTLDAMFVHRLRIVEGRVDNRLNEVRVLCASMLQNGGIVRADRSIKFNPGPSILPYQSGDRSKLTEVGFIALSGVFFAEIESKFLNWMETVAQCLMLYLTTD